jgi:hypothetical protein
MTGSRDDEIYSQVLTDKRGEIVGLIFRREYKLPIIQNKNLFMKIIGIKLNVLAISCRYFDELVVSSLCSNYLHILCK